MAGGDGVIKSGPSAHGAALRFINYSRRRVDIIWYDYRGICVKYKTLMPFQYLDVNTYVGHFWSCQDTNTGDRLLTQRLEVFETTYEYGIHTRQRKIIKITIAIYSLKERCIQVVRQLVDSHHYNDLGLPRTLVTELGQRKNLVDTSASKSAENS